LLAIEGAGGREYWLGFDNFYAITRYNRSLHYALAVFQLSREIRSARRAGR
jgi:membrane-bound lytic murein transglycosylase B